MCKNPSVSILMRLHDKKILIRETCMIQTVHICYNSVIKHVHIWGVIWHMQQNVIKCSMVQLPQFSYTYWLIHFNSDSENCNDMKSWIVGWWLQRTNLQCKNGIEYNKKSCPCDDMLQWFLKSTKFQEWLLKVMELIAIKSIHLCKH